jgi:thioredoxin reductase (NADPH)
VDDVLGSDKVEGLSLRNVKTDARSTLNIDGVFVAVGVLPNSQSFSNLVSIDDTGNIIADDRMATSVEGIFTAGDIRSNSSRQVSTAVGDGATAGISAYKYLRES